jgi:hypothetical protein
MRSPALPLVAAVTAACGNNGLNDAAPKLCDFTEAADSTNNATPEMSGLTIGGPTKEICGQIDSGHYDSATKTVDLDTYRFTVTTQSDLRVRFFGASDVSKLSEFSVLVFDTSPAPVLLNGYAFDATLGDHGVFRASLAPGTYDVFVRGRADADIAAPLKYQVRFLADAECPQQVANADYKEQHDGADNHGNDVLAIDFSKTPSATASAGTAESTGLKFDAGVHKRISGSAANVTGTDTYMDRDTYAISTGSANELSIRLDWAGGADLDYVVFAESSMIPTGGSTVASQTGPEVAIFPVLPSTHYRLWIGAKQGSTTLPAAYDASVCASHAAP